MLLNRWQPFSPGAWNQLEQFQSEMNRLLDQFGLGGLSPRVFAGAYPPVNVWEEDGRVFVEAELPGMRLDDLEIYVSEGNQLTLKGERRPCETKQAVWHRRERGLGKFSRTFTLPVPVDADRVEARFDNGVLKVVLPKSEAALPRRITVKSE